MPRFDVHVCVGSPLHLYGVSKAIKHQQQPLQSTVIIGSTYSLWRVAYSLTPLFHYQPAYPRTSPDTSFSGVQVMAVQTNSLSRLGISQSNMYDFSQYCLYGGPGSFDQPKLYPDPSAKLGVDKYLSVLIRRSAAQHILYLSLLVHSTYLERIFTQIGELAQQFHSRYHLWT